MTTRQRKLIEALKHQLAEERERSAVARGRAAKERRQFLAIIENLMKCLSNQRNGGNGRVGS